MEVLKYGNLTLKEHSKEIDTFDDELRNIADHMYETMVREDGIGLAAPQVGLLIRLVVIDLGEDFERLDLVNPEIVEASEEVDTANEGCLSIPGVYAPVERSSKLKVQARDLTGEPFVLEAEGLLARAIQHELDHLNGVLFVDRISKLEKFKLKSDLKKIKKQYNPVTVK